MQLGVARNSFQIAWLTANTRWVVVHVQIQTRRAEDRHEVAQKTVQQVQASQLCSGFYQPVVVGGKNVQAITNPGAACKAHQKGDQRIESLLTPCFFRRSN